MSRMISGKKKKINKMPVIVAVVLCAVSMFSIAMVYKNAVKKQQDTKELLETENTELTDLEEENRDLVSENSDNGKVKIQLETEAVGVVDGSRKENVQNNDVNTSDVLAEQVNYFSENNILTWPVQGEIIMEYSMESPVYFNTLNQYSYLNGVIIQAERGMPVYASADGTVKSVDYTDEFGWTVTVDMGNGYLATYGQLADIKVSEGDNIITGAVIAEVAVPSKFYSLEGDNVYFSLKNGEEYIDPLEYLE